MTWRSTALVSGAGLLATWLASAPTFDPQSPAQPPSAPAAARDAGATIQREAERLHVRLQRNTAYREPSRNPFRFRPREVAPPRPEAPVVDVTPTVPALPEPPTFRMMLSGIAEEAAGETVVRTAIISTPTEVFLVKEGDQVAGRYQVIKIGADAVELSRLDDGSTVRLGLRP